MYDSDLTNHFSVFSEEVQQYLIPKNQKDSGLVNTMLLLTASEDHTREACSEVHGRTQLRNVCSDVHGVWTECGKVHMP